MRYIIILIALGIVMFLARNQLTALTPADVPPAKPGTSREYVNVAPQKTTEQCAEELGPETGEEAMLRCTTGYDIKMQVGR
ncbi:MAG: hypothetical protein ACRETN_12260 [Nevskiales bacterium]